MANQHNSRRAKTWQIWVMGLGLIFLALVLAYLLVMLWPESYPKFPEAMTFKDTGEQANVGKTQCLAGWCPGPDARLLAMVMIAGGLGSFVHIAKSFGDFVGNERFMASWIWWYILKPFIGMILAVVLYLVIRGGFLTVSTGTTPPPDTVNINLYGLMGMACLAGMFAKQATDKLGEVFDVLFKTASKEKRRDPMDNQLPIITEARPRAVAEGISSILLLGANFARNAVVQIDGVNRETRYNGSTELVFQLLPGDTVAGRPLGVVVVNPPPGGGTSAPMLLPSEQTQAAPLAGAVPVSLSGPSSAVDDAEADDIDGCDCPIDHETADEDLPAATGGVQA